jgi:tetratricopeptide (TPR) repeat protein
MPAPSKSFPPCGLRPLAALLALVLLGSGATAAGADPPAQPAPSGAAAPVPSATAAPSRRSEGEEALRAANEAVERNPRSVDARWDRIRLVWQLRGAALTAAERQRLEVGLRADLAVVIAAAPDSTAAGVARDFLKTLDCGAPCATGPAACTPEATAEHEQAERLFGAQRFAEAIPHYERAAAACPADAGIWSDLGDTYFRLGDFAKAQQTFAIALTKNPWHAPAHRFLADTFGRQHMIEPAYHECVLAVISSPTYDAAWAYLRSILATRHGVWTRVVAVLPSVTQDSSGKKVDVMIDPDNHDAGWMTYALFLAGSLTPPGGGKPGGVAPTALERQREAAREAVKVVKEMGSGASPFWEGMARADQAGFLDEAIFLNLPDAALLAEYPAYRAEHRDRLVKYVETVLAPLPAAP